MRKTLSDMCSCMLSERSLTFATARYLLSPRGVRKMATARCIELARLAARESFGTGHDDCAY